MLLGSVLAESCMSQSETMVLTPCLASYCSKDALTAAVTHPITFTKTILRPY